MTTPDNGWYPDPIDPESIRWWTGSAWSTHALPADAIATAPASPTTAIAIEPESAAQVEPEVPPLLPDGPIRLAPAARVKNAVPRQVRRPPVETTAPIIVPSQGKVIDPNNLVAASSSMTLLPGAGESEERAEPSRRRRRRTKQ